jgi:hypothetical protein
MSSLASPISAARFASALADLPVSSLFAKAAELRNSIAHLEISNIQLQRLSDEGDEDYENAISENVEVIDRMKERIELVKNETVGRGIQWSGGNSKNKNEINRKGEKAEIEEFSVINAGKEPRASAPIATAGLRDYEVALQLGEIMKEDDREGLHL